MLMLCCARRCFGSGLSDFSIAMASLISEMDTSTRSAR